MITLILQLNEGLQCGRMPFSDSNGLERSDRTITQTVLNLKSLGRAAILGADEELKL